jgi:hypothetical protein
MNLWQRPVPPATAAYAQQPPSKDLVVDRLVVRKELIVSDTGQPWEKGFEQQQIARGLYATTPAVAGGITGLWVRDRLIKTEIDDPFDDRFHACSSDGSVYRAPGHISWNVWSDGAWRQLAIIQGEGLEHSEVGGAATAWNGANHPGRLRFQSFRPHHPEPLTDAIIGQGMMSVGGGGYGGGGLPYPSEVLQLWGGKMTETPIAAPAAPKVAKDDGSGKHRYALIAIGPQGRRSDPSPEVKANGRATLLWNSPAGVDAHIVVRDGKPIGPLRMEGGEKRWTDTGKR